jgi:hypothetical protein
VNAALSLRRLAPVALVALAFAAPVAVAEGSFDWFAAKPTPAGWKHLALPSGNAVLWYPPGLSVVRHDVLSLSVAEVDRKGNYLAFLNATPEEGERLDTWPEFRLKRLLANAVSAREEARAVDLPFRGGTGSCVMDVYVTRAKHNHYREIACFVREKRSGGVVVAAAPVSQWDRVAPQLKRAIGAFRITG